MTHKPSMLDAFVNYILPFRPDRIQPAEDELEIVRFNLFNLAMKKNHRSDFDEIIAFLPVPHPLHRKALTLRNWYDTPEPVGTKRMSSDLGSASTKMHNRDEWSRCVDGKLYVLYDHHRSAFWGADRSGYCYRKHAGIYDKAGAADVVLDSSRYFTIEEVPPEVIKAMGKDLKVTSARQPKDVLKGLHDG